MWWQRLHGKNSLRKAIRMSEEEPLLLAMLGGPLCHKTRQGHADALRPMWWQRLCWTDKVRTALDMQEAGEQRLLLPVLVDFQVMMMGTHSPNLSTQ